MEPMTYPDETDYQIIGVAAVLFLLLIVGVGVGMFEVIGVSGLAQIL
jgi:hypothetical protein